MMPPSTHNETAEQPRDVEQPSAVGSDDDSKRTFDLTRLYLKNEVHEDRAMWCVILGLVFMLLATSFASLATGILTLLLLIAIHCKCKVETMPLIGDYFTAEATIQAPKVMAMIASVFAFLTCILMIVTGVITGYKGTCVYSDDITGEGSGTCRIAGLASIVLSSIWFYAGRLILTLSRQQEDHNVDIEGGMGGEADEDDDEKGGDEEEAQPEEEPEEEQEPDEVEPEEGIDEEAGNHGEDAEQVEGDDVPAAAEELHHAQVTQQQNNTASWL